MQVKDSIRKWREQRSYKQQYMADELHITQQAYQKLESGKTKLLIDVAEKIALILDVPLAEIYITDASDAAPLTTKERELYEMVIEEKEKNNILHQIILKLVTTKGKNAVKIIEAIILPENKNGIKIRVRK